LGTIISASRRTDIPAYYADWMMRRLHAGWCEVPNPYNAHQVARIDLAPAAVDAIVFWTRNPAPLLPHLAAIEAMGHRFLFHYTLMDNPRLLETHRPSLAAAIRTFHRLAAIVGPQRVIWRYDPIVFSSITPPGFHRDRFAAIAAALSGATQRVVISIMDDYRKIRPRMDALASQGAVVAVLAEEQQAAYGDLLAFMAATAASHGMAIQSCSEPFDLAPSGIPHGACIDPALIQSALGVAVTQCKDQTQRPACGCAVSRDIGMYDSCLTGCQYCYANRNFAASRSRHRAHDPASPRLIPSL
jgi:hypothetical protein